MAERVTGITIEDIKDERKAAVAREMEHAEMRYSFPQNEYSNNIPGEEARMHAIAHRLHLRTEILDTLIHQGQHLPEQNGWKPTYHPDVLDNKLDQHVDRGDVTPVLVPLAPPNGKLEVASTPLYVVNHDNFRHGADIFGGNGARLRPAPLRELVEAANPEHTPMNKVTQVIREIGSEVVARLGLDPATTEIRPINMHDQRAMTRTRALDGREYVTTTPAYPGSQEMATGIDYRLGSHSPDQNTKPTRLVIARQMPKGK